MAGKGVTSTDEFMIIARLESLIAGKGVEDALERAEQYILAGVDGIMIHSSKQDPAEILTFAEAYRSLCQRLRRRPELVCVPTTYNTVTEPELVSSGFTIIIHANHLLRAAYKAMTEAARTILMGGRSLEADPLCAPVKEIFSVVGYDEIIRKDQERSEGIRLLEKGNNGAAPRSDRHR